MAAMTSAPVRLANLIGPSALRASTMEMIADESTGNTPWRAHDELTASPCTPSQTGNEMTRRRIDTNRTAVSYVAALLNEWRVCHEQID
jgi:hypothetical protein